jgi:hypothetical protein
MPAHPSLSQASVRRIGVVKDNTAQISWRIWLIAILAVIGPVYWLPGVSPDYIRYAKSAMLFILVFSQIFSAKESTPSLSGLKMISLIGVFTFLSSIALLYDDDNSEIQQYILSSLYCLFYVIALFNIVSVRNIPQVRKALSYALWIYPIGSLLIILSGIGLIPDFDLPRELFSGVTLNVDTVGLNTLSGSGFGGSRTGWGLATCVASTMLLANNGWDSSSKTKLNYFVIIVTLSAIYQMGARGSFYAFLLCSLISYLRYTKGSPALKISTLSLFAAAYVISMSFRTGTRFDLDISGMSFSDAMAAITSDRYGTWVFGVDRFFESPIVGVGIAGSRLGGNLDVHNAWIASAARSGLVGFIPAILILYQLVVLSFHRSVETTKNYGLGIVVLSGILLSMIEPGFPFGAFFNSTAFWLAVVLQAPALDLALPSSTSSSYLPVARHPNA